MELMTVIKVAMSQKSLSGLEDAASKPEVGWHVDYNCKVRGAVAEAYCGC